MSARETRSVGTLGAVVFLLALSVALTLVVSVTPAPAHAQLREPSANPNRPSFGLQHRGALRGTFGAELPLLAADTPEGTGVSLALAPLFELHEPNHSSQLLPSQYWRARLPLTLSYSQTTPLGLWRADLAATHESDHESSHRYSHPGFLAQNDLALRASLSFGEAVRVHVGIEAALYLVSCTRLAAPCRNFAGSTSAGGALDFGATFARVSVLALHPFVAAHGSFLVAHDLIERERRAALHLGLLRSLGPGELQLFALAYAGSDVGRARASTLHAVGAGLRLVLALWPPAPAPAPAPAPVPVPVPVSRPPPLP